MIPSEAIAHACGLCGPHNPGGSGGWGFTIHTPSERVCEDYGRVAAGPEVTNNAIEYVAVGKAVQAYQVTGRPGPLLVRSSSQLVIMQMTGVWPVKQGSYIGAFTAVQALVARCSFDVQWEWVPITQNMWASILAKTALAKGFVRPQI